MVESFVMLPTLSYIFGVNEGFHSGIKVWERDAFWIIPGGFRFERATRMVDPGAFVLFEEEALFWSQHDVWQEYGRFGSMLNPWMRKDDIGGVN